MKTEFENRLEEIEFFFPDMQVTRSSLFKGDVVPLHNHGNRYGIVYVLKGRCQIANYAVVEKKETSYILELIEDKEYTDNQFTIISQKNNVHYIQALEDTTFFDVFSVEKSREFFQEFLKITHTVEGTNQIIAEVITLEEANIAKHLLEKKCTEVEIND